jgi:hypothetical protein
MPRYHARHDLFFLLRHALILDVGVVTIYCVLVINPFPLTVILKGHIT